MRDPNTVVRPTSTEPVMVKHLNARGIQLGLPVNGNFELTARCNFNCKMCYVHLPESAGQIFRELTADQWLSLASDAKDRGMIFTLLTGGEPMIRQDFAYIYEELVKMGLLVSVNTNLSLYNEDLRALFKKYPPSRVNVSLYGGCEGTYRQLCGNASYEKVVGHLRSMREDGFQVRLNVSFTPYNVGDMEEIHRLSMALGLQAKAAAYMYPPVRVGGESGHNEARFEPGEAGAVMARWNALRDTKERLIQRAERILANRAKPQTAAEPERVMCRAGRSSFWMTWDGRMMPCGTMNAEASYPLSDGFAKAWEETRQRTADIRLPADCAVCPERLNCHVCAAICQCESGSFDGKPDYLCEMTRVLCEETLKAAKQAGGTEE